jgi:hypothetical protein
MAKSDSEIDVEMVSAAILDNATLVDTSSILFQTKSDISCSSFIPPSYHASSDLSDQNIDSSALKDQKARAPSNTKARQTANTHADPSNVIVISEDEELAPTAQKIIYLSDDTSRSVINISDSSSDVYSPTTSDDDDDLDEYSGRHTQIPTRVSGSSHIPQNSRPTARQPIGSSTNPPLDLVGTIFESIDLAKETIYAYQEEKGFKFVHGQSKKTRAGILRKLILRCTSAGPPRHTHEPTIDPADHRQGRTVRTGCGALANLNREGTTAQFFLSSAIWEHNHSGLPEGGKVLRPPTEQQKRLIANLVDKGRFQRKQLRNVLSLDTVPGRALEDRQISNIVNNLHNAANKQVSLHST